MGIRSYLHALLPSASKGKKQGAGVVSPQKVQGKSAKDHPVLNGRYEFTQVFSDLAKGKRNWQITAYIALSLLVAVTAAFIVLALSARMVPYVVEVDKLGRARAFGPAEQIDQADERVVVAQLSMFVRNIRSVFSDPVAQQDMIRRAYAFAGPDAQVFLDSYFTNPDHDPRRLSQEFSRQVEVQSVIALPGTNTYKVQWSETQITRSGRRQLAAWEAYLTVSIIPPEDTRTIEENPLGVTITDLTWARITAPSSSKN